jgi:hypothetical protein
LGPSIVTDLIDHTDFEARVRTAGVGMTTSSRKDPP